MFYVTDINTGEEYKVYSVRVNRLGETLFLMYNGLASSWEWLSSSYYKPTVE